MDELKLLTLQKRLCGSSLNMKNFGVAEMYPRRKEEQRFLIAGIRKTIRDLESITKSDVGIVL